MASTRIVLLVAWMAMLGRGVASGQDPLTVAPGSRVHIWPSAPKMAEQTGTLREVRGDTLVVHTGSVLAKAKRIPFAAIDSLEVSLNHDSHQGAMTLGGIVGGFGVGFLVYKTSAPCQDRSGLQGLSDFGCDFGRAGKVLFGGLGGALLGGLIAAAVVPERWKRVAPGAIRVALDARPGAGVGVGLSVPF